MSPKFGLKVVYPWYGLGDTVVPDAPRSTLVQAYFLRAGAERERFPSTNLKDWGHWAACSGFGAFYGATFENSICPEFESFD